MDKTLVGGEIDNVEQLDAPTSEVNECSYVCSPTTTVGMISQL